MKILVYQRSMCLFASIIVASILFINPMVSKAENSQPTVRDHMRIRVKEGKINEAMSAAKELIEY